MPKETTHGTTIRILPIKCHLESLKGSGLLPQFNLQWEMSRMGIDHGYDVGMTLV